jgi:ArsR family transcriptional regulator, arsenate/arsenite/antimonite-responsive transcriptional repressor
MSLVKTSEALCCPPILESPLRRGEAERLAATFKAVADPARLRLLSLIASHPGGEACVCELTAPLGLSQPTVSHHLKVLSEAGLLEREQRGVWAYYRVDPATMESLRGALAPRPAPVAR